MRNRGLIITVMLLLTACGSIKTKNTVEIENQDQLLLATLWYQKSAELKAIYYQCYSNAESALVKNLAGAEGVLLPAVMLDIDETVLDNSPFQVWQIYEKKGFDENDWNRWVNRASAKALPGAVEFTQFADSLGVEVFYVSNRKTTETAPTIENMSRLGFANADSMHMMLKESSSSKVARRAEIEKNYEILLMIGDNLADLDGVFEKRPDGYGISEVEARSEMFGTRYIILPNPMYGTWLSEMMKTAKGETVRAKLLNCLEGF